MNERERAILRGKHLNPQTADEAALKYAVENGGGGGKIVLDLDADFTFDVEDGTWVAKDSYDGTKVFSALGKGVPVWVAQLRPKDIGSDVRYTKYMAVYTWHEADDGLHIASDVDILIENYKPSADADILPHTDQG